MALSRREFIQLGAASGAAALTTTNVLAGKAAPSLVYAGKGSADEVLPGLLDAMGGIAQFVKPGARVLIKPNMSFSNPPEWGTTTSPTSVAALTKLCLGAEAKRVIICDNTLHDPELCKQKTGIADAIRGLKGAVIFVPKRDALFENRSDERAKELKSVDVVKEVYNADCFISLSAAKSHSAAGVSFNIKGLMGLIKERGAFHREMDLHRAVAEQLYYMRPHISIVDATWALLDNGPGGPGKVARLDTFVAGTDPVAVDSHATTLASWYGRSFDGTKVKHLKIANELGFGNNAPENIRVTTV